MVLALGLLVSIGTAVHVATGGTVGGSSSSTSYTGYVEGNNNPFSCWAATRTTKESGPEDVYAYVEIVNKDGYKIGDGAENTGTNNAYSGTVTRSGGKNAYGSVGTANASSRAFASLY
jgi:hypothetical protein